MIVLWRLQMKLCLRDLAEILLLRGLVFSHVKAVIDAQLMQRSDVRRHADIRLRRTRHKS
jgi:hypothetical protein